MNRSALLLLLVAIACRADCPRVEPFDSVLEHDSGPGAVDCGCIDMKGDHRNAARADDCVVQAFERGKAFHIRYLDQGKESPFMSAKVRAADGRVFFYSFDGRVSKVTRFTCTRPELQSHDGHRHLICMACLECTAAPAVPALP